MGSCNFVDYGEVEFGIFDVVSYEGLEDVCVLFRWYIGVGI